MRPWARAFAAATLVHVTLPDFQEPGWLGPAALQSVGALWLLYRPAPVAFALCLVGGLWPLLFLRDVLTQSTLLVACAALGVAGRWLPARDVRAAVVWLTAGTYLLAGFHKLNSAFFDPTWSCANHAWAQVMARWPVPDLGVAAPWLAVGVEVALALLVLWRHPLRWTVGVVFHLGLTVTLAPAFAAVMLQGYVAGTTSREAVRLRRVWRRRWPALLACGLALASLDAAAGGFAWLTFPKVAFAGALVPWALLAAGPVRRPRPPARWVHAVTAAWVLHGLTPYTGLNYQQTAAMLSNLRIDRGCANHLLLPEPPHDDYVRIDEASIGGRAKRERVVRETLWNISALHTMRRNWCIPENRPVRYAGTWRGRPFVVEDLCAEGWLRALPGAERLPAGWQRFQKNLRRECPTACVH